LRGWETAQIHDIDPSAGKSQFPSPQTACACGNSYMGIVMANDPSESEQLLRQARGGDSQALGELFERYRERLRQMVRLRLDRRLYGRLDPSDVLQEAFLDLNKRFPEYARNPTVPFYLWLRSLTGQRLVTLYRHHLGTHMRDAGQEVSLYQGALPQASSQSLANQLLGRLTSPTQAAMRAEMQIRLQEALNTMDPLDREVLVLRHFEELSNNETAELLGLQKSAASKRYRRALERLTHILSNIPGLFP
jgi:RNA polymerase sigma-70 factor (ECF subfamily)